ncbi:Glutathione transport system permease protein GsiC [Anaerolineae bacterium]|nr:Glutathione transport system permease protein GsiC [Anaerolineae bacterium]
MTSWLIGRFLKGLLTLVAVLVLVFLLIRVVPSDPAAMLVPEDAPPEMVEYVRHLWGLDRPIHEQFATYVINMLSGNAGDSYQYSSLSRGSSGTPAFGLVMSRLPNTLLLALITLALSVSIAVPLGVITALNADSWLDHTVFSISMMLTSLPNFFVGIMLIYIFALWLGILPTGGIGKPENLVLPAVVLSLHFTVTLTRLTRTEMGRVLRSDYITTANAKGLSKRIVFWKHALKNVMIPLVTVIGLRLGGLFNGAVVVETMFRWPGIGKMMVDAIAARDYPIVQVIVPLSAIVFVGINILVDLIYGLVDPRVRAGGMR